jgi:hypothetical protein
VTPVKGHNHTADSEKGLERDESSVLVRQNKMRHLVADFWRPLTSTSRLQPRKHALDNATEFWCHAADFFGKPGEPVREWSVHGFTALSALFEHVVDG